MQDTTTNTDTTITTGTKYLKTLSEAGVEDLVLLDSDVAQRVLTDKRTEIVRTISEQSPESVRELARMLDRDKSVLHRDLRILQEASVVAFEENGRAKRPVLAHENVFVEPVVFDGQPLDD